MLYLSLSCLYFNSDLSTEVSKTNMEQKKIKERYSVKSSSDCDHVSTQIIKISHNEIVLEVPKPSPKFAYSLERFIGLSI